MYYLLMDIFALLTDPKVLLIIAVLLLLGALAIYTWRQSNDLYDLKSKHEKITQQVKHGVILSEHEGENRIRPEIASNMSEETYHEETDNEDTDNEENEDNEDKDDDNEPETEDEDDDVHNDYIKELIKMHDRKRADDFYIMDQQQSGHNGPVYDSEEEELIFDNYEDKDDDDVPDEESEVSDVHDEVPDEVPDEVNEAELMVHAENELKLANTNSHQPKNPQQVQNEMIQRIEQHIKSQTPELKLEKLEKLEKATPTPPKPPHIKLKSKPKVSGPVPGALTLVEPTLERPKPLITPKPLAEKSKPIILLKK